MERESRTSDGGVDRDPRYRARFDPAGERSLLRTVTEVLAELTDQEPTALEPPLATVAAWDALERLLAEQVDAVDSSIHHVEFQYESFLVAVYGDGVVHVYDATD